MKRTAIFAFTWLVLMVTVCAQELEGPIETHIDQWQPVLPGKWIVSTKRFEGGHEPASFAATTKAETLACPYSALLVLRSHTPVKLGEPGCVFLTYRLSKDEYHIVSRCRTLAGKDHYEVTTLTVSSDGKSFRSATSWTEPKSTVTLRSEGAWSAACGKE
jgi:hypothetical protein